jgi:hypothetical protein
MPATLRFFGLHRSPMPFLHPAIFLVVGAYPAKRNLDE